MIYGCIFWNLISLLSSKTSFKKRVLKIYFGFWLLNRTSGECYYITLPPWYSTKKSLQLTTCGILVYLLKFTWKKSFGFIQYVSLWRYHKRIFHWLFLCLIPHEFKIELCQHWKLMKLYLYENVHDSLLVEEHHNNNFKLAIYEINTACLLDSKNRTLKWNSSK